MYENVIVGKPLVDADEMFAYNRDDWNNNECNKTLITEERYLPRILVECGAVKSTSEVKRNKPQLCKTLDKLDFFEIKWGKKHIFIEVGN